MGTHPIFESDFDCLTEMSDESSDEDYCPTRGKEKEFDKTAAAQSLKSEPSTGGGMSRAASKTADDIFASFKSGGKAEEKRNVTPEQKEQKPDKETEKEFDFAGETITVKADQIQQRPPVQKPVAIRKRASKLDEILSKRPKLTVMKKTQLDWAKHKKRGKNRRRAREIRALQRLALRKTRLFKPHRFPPL